MFDKYNFFPNKNIFVLIDNLFSEKSISISSPTSVDYEIPNLRSPPLLIHQQVIPRLMSRQTSVSILSVATPSSARRISRGSLAIITNLHKIVSIT